MKWLEWLFVRPEPARKGEVNYSLIDKFTFVHFAIGLGYGALGLGFGITLFLSLFWEFIENPLKVHLPFIFPHATQDTFQNMIGDTVALMIGWFCYWYFNP